MYVCIYIYIYIYIYIFFFFFFFFIRLYFFISDYLDIFFIDIFLFFGGFFLFFGGFFVFCFLNTQTWIWFCLLHWPVGLLKLMLSLYSMINI